jgi:phage-related protein
MGLIENGINITFSADLSSLSAGIDAASSLLSGFASSVSDISSGINQSFSQAFESLTNVPSLDTSSITDGVSLVSQDLQSLENNASEAYSSLTDTPNLDLSEITDSTSQVSQDLLSLQSSTMETISDLDELGAESSDLGEKLTEAGNGSSFFKNSLSTISDNLQGLGSKIGDMVSGPISGFSNTISSLGSKLPDLGSVMAKVAGVASNALSGAFGLASQGVGMLKDQLTSSIEVAEKHQQVMDQTTRTLSAAGNASGITAQSVEKLAESFSQNTKFSENTIQSSENLLLTFDKIGKQTFPDATRAMLDMSQALGINTTKAAKDLGRALEDPAKAIKDLAKEHVNLTAAQQQSIKTMMAHNDVAGAQKVVLEAVEGAFGGAAQAAGKTFAGQMQVLKNIVEDVKIKIGTALLPIINQFIGAISSMAMPILQNFSNWFSSVGVSAIQKFSNIANGIFFSLDMPVKVFASSIEGLGMWLGKLIGTASQVAGMILGQFTGSFGNAGNQVIKFISSALFTLDDILIQIGYKIRDFSKILYEMDFGEKIDAVKEFGASLANEFGPPLKNVAAILGGQFKTDLAWLGTTFNQIGGWIKSSLMPALATLVPPFMSIADTVVKNILPALAEFYATGHQLVESMLTPLIGVLENILPPVISIAGWLAGALAEGFKLVAPLVKGLADVISGLVNFFTKTEVGAALVKASLIALSIPVSILAIGFTALAIESIAAFIASIPAMVGGFLAGAAAAWTMAAGVIAATWPFLAIAAVVVAVVAVIILAVQHWGDIVNWLKGAWSSIVSFFTGLWNNIKNIFSGVGKWFQDRFSEASKGVQNAWSGLQDHAQQAGNGIKNAWDDASKKTSDAFMYMYKHSSVFQAIVDNLTGSTRAGIAMLQAAWKWIVDAWTATSNWLVGAWNTTAKFASDLWKKVSNAVKDGWNAAVKWVQDIWTSISNTFAAAWNTYIVKPLTSLWTSVSTFFSNVWTNYVAKPLSAMWTNVSTAFSNAWTDHVSKPISDLGTNISNAVSNWATSAWQWGVNLITGLANGIVSAARGALASAMTTVANIVKALIGWHSPTKEGPGSDSDKWAPNLVKMMSAGLESGIPQIQSAVNKLAMPIALSLNPAVSNYKAASGLPNFKYPTSSTGSGGASPIIVNVHPVVQSEVYMDHKKVTDIVATQLANKTRMKGGVRSH